MSRNEPTLAHTVHHGGRVYELGMTAEEIGPDAAKFGAHVWEGGLKPETFPADGAERGGSQQGSPPVPPPSALPGPDTASAIADATGTQAPTVRAVEPQAEPAEADGGGRRAQKGRSGS